MASRNYVLGIFVRYAGNLLCINCNRLKRQEHFGSSSTVVSTCRFFEIIIFRFYVLCTISHGYSPLHQITELMGTLFHAMGVEMVQKVSLARYQR